MHTTETDNHGCACGASKGLRACGCYRRADEFLAAPTAAYKVSRRELLRSALAGGLAAAAIPLLETQAQADLFMPSISDQKRLGAQAAQQVLQQYHEVNDDRARNFARVGARLENALNAHDRNTWDWHFHVIQNSEINAFAVPGGNIFMFTGLLDRITSDNELAAVTGHEMTHVRLQHWAKAVASQQKRELGIGLLLGLTHAGRGWQEIAGIGDTLLTLRYSRSEEDQADAGGLQDMVAAGYDPHGMLDLFHLLQTASRNGGPPQFLSDHPLTSERIRHTEQRIAQMQGNR